jgi:hypothetical protein
MWVIEESARSLGGFVLRGGQGQLPFFVATFNPIGWAFLFQCRRVESKCTSDPPYI